MDNAAAETLSDEKQQSAPDPSAIVPDAGPTQSQASEEVPTTKLQFFAILVALVFSISTVALDGTIIVTAIPRITDEYQALSDVGWYGSAFTLPSAALVPLFGKLYALFSTKWTFLTALFVFEIGSLVSAVAPSSVAFHRRPGHLRCWFRRYLQWCAGHHLHDHTIGETTCIPEHYRWCLRCRDHYSSSDWRCIHRLYFLEM